jgi:hypothetical protein
MPDELYFTADANKLICNAADGRSMVPPLPSSLIIKRALQQAYGVRELAYAICY